MNYWIKSVLLHQSFRQQQKLPLIYSKMKLILLIFLMGGTLGEDPMNNEVSSEFDIVDLIDNIDDIPGLNVEGNITMTEEDLPGSALDPGDYELAGDPDFTMPTLDEKMLEENDPILQAKAFEGDILNVNSEQLKQQLTGNVANDFMRNAIKDKWRKWPNGVVPYVISSNYNRRERAVIASAMKEYHDKTCIKFRPRFNEHSYIHIVKGRGCSSSVGRTGYAQQVSLGNGCVYEGIVIHELMHAIGFWHEQSRADRDDTVMIYRNNILPGMAYNFLKYSYNKIDHLNAPYDTCSVMHYGAYAFSKNRRKTIGIRPNIRTQCKLGQRDGFSKIDLEKINTLYSCSGFEQTGGSTGGGVQTTAKPVVTVNQKCQDTHHNCATWADSGECEKNPTWMLKYCPVACKECKNKCSDHHPRCSEWAGRGECRKNHHYMHIYCKKACKVCKGPSCVDERSECSYWQSKGYCNHKSYRNFMSLRCKKSCNKCSP